MPSVVSLAVKSAAMPPQVSPEPFKPIDFTRLLGPSYATLGAAFGAHQLLRGFTGDSVAAAMKGLGGPPRLPALFGQIDSALIRLASPQGALAPSARAAIAALGDWQVRGIPGMGDSIVASGVGSTVATIKDVAGSQAVLMGLGSAIGPGFDWLTRLPQDSARLGVIDSPFIPYPMPEIHIRREPAPLPHEEEGLPIARERGSRRPGRPRGSYQCSPELVVNTYKRLAESGRYVTQEHLAHALGIELRTLQNYLSPRGMGLGWPLKR